MLAVPFPDESILEDGWCIPRADHGCEEFRIKVNSAQIIELFASPPYLYEVLRHYGQQFIKTVRHLKASVNRLVY